jgi:hypothetical protein
MKNEETQRERMNPAKPSLHSFQAAPPRAVATRSCATRREWSASDVAGSSRRNETKTDRDLCKTLNGAEARSIASQEMFVNRAEQCSAFRLAAGFAEVSD